MRTSRYSYTAHIMTPDNVITELAGTKDFSDASACFDYLARRAANMGGKIIGHDTTVIKGGSPAWGFSKKAYNVPLLAAPKDDTPTIFGSVELFGEYTDRYSNATPVTYKVTEE